MFHDPQQVPEYTQLYPREPSPAEREQAVQNREMAVRLTWKPYMHDPRRLARAARPGHGAHAHRLGAAGSDHPCGMWDPVSPGHPGARGFVVLEHCGHAPHLEKPDEFVRIALDFLS